MTTYTTRVSFENEDVENWKNEIDSVIADIDNVTWTYEDISGTLWIFKITFTGTDETIDKVKSRI